MQTLRRVASGRAARPPTLRNLGVQRMWKSTFNLSSEHVKVLAATAPAVIDANTKFTSHFYNRMFTAVPCLRNVFNQTNQRTGGQQTKLFDSILEAALSVVEDRPVDMTMVAAVNHKHAALGVQAAQYDVVAEHILGTIRELLTDDAAVLEAWGALYGQVAAALVAGENQIYADSEAMAGGWLGKRDFVISDREMVSDVIAKITFKPADGKAVAKSIAGQYTTVWAKPESWKWEQPRHYTLSTASNENQYVVSVKKQGLMSDYLHTCDLGTSIKLSMPYGVFSLSENVWLKNRDTPLVFLSAGVGITPTLAMMEAFVDSGPDTPVTWLFAGKSGAEHAYRNVLIDAAKNCSNLTRRVWYDSPIEADGAATPTDNVAKFHYTGHMDLTQVKDLLHIGKGAQYYYCGPKGWMQNIEKQLKDYGVPESSLFNEGFA